MLRWCTDVSVRRQLSDQTICLPPLPPPNTPIKPLWNGIFYKQLLSALLLQSFQLKTRTLIMAGKVVLVVVRTKLISGSCVSMNSEAELQCVLIAEEQQQCTMRSTDRR